MVLKVKNLVEGVAPKIIKLGHELKPILLTPTVMRDLPKDVEPVEEEDLNANPNDTPLEDLWQQALENDEFEQEILGLLRNSVRFLKKIPLTECIEYNSHLYFRYRRYVPDLEVL